MDSPPPSAARAGAFTAGAKPGASGPTPRWIRGVRRPMPAAMQGNVQDLAPEEAARRLAAGEFELLDVRSPEEWQAARIPGARLVPIGELPAHLDELDPEKPYLLYCSHGQRSLQAAHWLAALGFERIHNLRGGLAAWSGPLDRRPPAGPRA